MTYSQHFKETTNAVNAIESPLALVEIEHSGLVTPVRIVNDMQDIVHLGENYQALNFSIVFPSQPESGQPEARIEIDNVGKELMQWLELSSGGSGATCKIKQVLRSTPDVIDYEVKLYLTDILATPTNVSGRLSFTDVYNKQGMPTTYNKSTAIGLF